MQVLIGINALQGLDLMRGWKAFHFSRMSLIQRLQQALDKLDPNPPPPPQGEIPKFYRKDYYDESILPLRKAVYQHKNARRQEYIATSQELEETWELFKMYHDSIINATSKDPKYYISYKKFKIVREKVLPKLRPYFTAKHFLGFKQTDKKLISASDFMEFIFKTSLYC